MTEPELRRRSTDRPAANPMSDIEHQWVRDMMNIFPSPPEAETLGEMVRGHEKVLLGSLRTDTGGYVPGVLQSMGEMKDEQRKTNTAVTDLKTSTEKGFKILTAVVSFLAIVLIGGNSATVWAPTIRALLGAH